MNKGMMKGKKMVKTLFKVTITAVMLLVMTVSAFAAGSIDANEQAILDELNSKKVSAEYILQAKNYFEKDEVSVTEEQAKDIIANIDDAAEIVKKAGIKSKEYLFKADTSVIDSILAKAQAAANVINLTVSYNGKSGVVTIKDSTDNIVATTDIGTKTTGADNITTFVTISTLGVVVVLLAIITKRNSCI